MFADNVQSTRRFIDAFNARDIEAIVACCAPDIELHSTFAAVGGATYRGHDGVRRWQEDLADAWREEIRVEPEAYFDLGEQTLAFYTVHARGRHSGAEVAISKADVFRWRDGLGVYWKAYVNREDALSDLGVSEDELKPIEP